MMRRVVQLGLMRFEFVGYSMEGSRVVVDLVVERRRGFQRSLSLLGFEVFWLGIKLREISKGQRGNSFLGNLRGGRRLLEFRVF